MHCKRKVDAGCEVYLIRSAGVLGQTATVLERMRAEADAIAPLHVPLRYCPLRTLRWMAVRRRSWWSARLPLAWFLLGS